ncbi:hypothetical protein LCGC14_2915390, partial [marine sediment metagenome]
MEQYNEEELSNAILNAIKFNPKTTNELQFIFTGKYEKRHINNCLYNLQKKGKVISTTSDHSSRPIWTSCVNNNDNKISSKAQKHEYECTITIVFIDLGNVHDSLQICEEFVKRGMISKVYAFADYHFNGYGINPSVNDPTNPHRYSNIKSEDFVEAILNLASIVAYTDDVPLEFIWGTSGPVEINLVNAWQLLSDFAGMLAWHIYADRNGTVHYTDRKPYDMGSDSATFTWSTAVDYVDIVAINHGISTKKLRNRVVVYGKNNIS